MIILYPLTLMELYLSIGLMLMKRIMDQIFISLVKYTSQKLSNSFLALLKSMECKEKSMHCQR